MLSPRFITLDAHLGVDWVGVPGLPIPPLPQDVMRTWVSFPKCRDHFLWGSGPLSRGSSSVPPLYINTWFSIFWHWLPQAMDNRIPQICIRAMDLDMASIDINMDSVCNRDIDTDIAPCLSSGQISQWPQVRVQATLYLYDPGDNLSLSYQHGLMSLPRSQSSA